MQKLRQRHKGQKINVKVAHDARSNICKKASKNWAFYSNFLTCYKDGVTRVKFSGRELSIEKLTWNPNNSADFGVHT
jgi:hypothetical protein